MDSLKWNRLIIILLAGLAILTIKEDSDGRL